MTGEGLKGGASEEELRRPFVSAIGSFVHGTVPEHETVPALSDAEYKAQLDAALTSATEAAASNDRAALSLAHNTINILVGYTEQHDAYLTQRRKEVMPEGIPYTILRPETGTEYPVFFSEGTELLALNEQAKQGQFQIPTQRVSVD